MKKDWIPVKGSNNLVRDKKSGAIININTNEIETARSVKEQRRKKDKELEDLKNDVKEMKSILFKLAEKLNG